MPPDVVKEVTLGREALLAILDCTVIGLLSRVYSEVSLQVALLREALATLSADEGLLPRVFSNVDFEP